MDTLVLQEDLFKGLSTAARFVSSRAQLPVLSNVLLSAEKGGLKIVATNLEMGITLHVGAKIETEGSITVPARMILEMVANLPPGQVHLKEHQGILNISVKSFKASLAGIASTEFPPVPGQIENKSLFLSKDAIQSLVSQVAFASAIDETRPVLTGVLIQFSGKRLRAVATDGFRLSLKDYLYEGAQGESKVLIPGKLLGEVLKVAGIGSTVVGIGILEREKQVMFEKDSTLLTGRLLEGEFPSYERIIPSKWTHKALLSRDEMTRAVKSAAVFAREAASVVKVKFLDGKLSISAESPQYGKEEVEVEAITEGGEVEMAFNYKYVLDFLESIKGSEFTIETEGSTTPGVFREKGDGDYTHLIMPVRIQG